MLSTGPTIRLATKEDAEIIASLAERTFRDTFAKDNDPEDMEVYVREAFSIESIRKELGEERSLFLLATVGESESPIGYAKLCDGDVKASITGPEPVELQRLYVDSDAIGLGIGSALMRECIDLAASRGFRTMWLGVWERNSRAISFYRRWKFETVGKQGFRLGRDLQTDFIMQRPIPSSSRSELTPDH